MGKVVKLHRKVRSFESEYAHFVDDLGGFLWHIRMSTNKPFTSLARELRLSPTTLLNLANRVTKNPQAYTVWKILKGLDDRQIIRHSLLEQYRPLTKKDLKNLKYVQKVA